MPVCRAMIRAGAISLLVLSGAVHAYGCRHDPCPADSWGGWENHGLWSGGVATGINLAIPTAPTWVKFGLCLTAGHVHETHQMNRRGERYSGRDMISNGIGCFGGIAITDRIRLENYPGYRGIAAVWEF